ncbi:hypothetical protein GW17_00007000 [Ensete ventricosum]|nr:hypothetical protein GW17_00007000 [Ensete ventricosum]
MSPHDKCERELMTTQPWFRAGHGTQDPSNSRHGDLLRIRITQWRRWTFRAPTLIGNVEASAVYLRRAWGGERAVFAGYSDAMACGMLGAQ